MNRQTQQSYHSDEQLLTSFRSSGNLEVLAELYVRYMELVYGVALRYLHQREQAEGVVLMLFEQMPRKLSAQKPACFRTWLHELVRRHCIEQLREQGRLIAIQPTSIQNDNQALINALCNIKSRPASLSSAINELPEQQRQSIDLFFVQRQSYADIAVSKACQVKSVKEHIKNGLSELMPSLEKLEQ